MFRCASLLECLDGVRDGVWDEVQDGDGDGGERLCLEFGEFGVRLEVWLCKHAHYTCFTYISRLQVLYLSYLFAS